MVTSLVPLLAMALEKENFRVHNTEVQSADENAVRITNASLTLVSTPSRSMLPLTSIGNNKTAGQLDHQTPIKHKKGLAIVGTGLTDKYICSQRDYTILS
jgi:hypothetical protein